MKLNHEEVIQLLDRADERARRIAGCLKVAVGSAIIKGEPTRIIYGANTTYPLNCREVGCRRFELYGEDSKNHRLPSDCRALHSEIDAITAAARNGHKLKGAAIVVTRYPCEACARAIVSSGITDVYYGRQQEISEETKKVFESGGVSVTWIEDWAREDTIR